MQEIKYNISFKERLDKQIDKSKEESNKSKLAQKLAKEGKYEEIFALYGSKYYLKFVPYKYKKNDIKKLLQEGKFEDIYIKYGPNIYEKYVHKMKAMDIYLETGSKSKSKGTFVLNKIKSGTKRTILPLFISGVTVFEGFPILIASCYDQIITKNSITYAEEISSYDKKIQEYAKQINKLKLTDLQIIMKVMNDMWDSIAGYADPKKNIMGFQRLDFLEENGIGVCRNMADDVCAKLNVINPEYNARTLTVKMDMDKLIVINNIDNSKRPSSENNSSSTQEDTNDISDNIIENIYGNHKVILVNIPNENITLVVDPTNPSIGIFRDGKIYMFSVDDGKLLTVKYLSTSMDGILSVFDYNKRRTQSFFDSNINIEELKQKYGVDAQNKALEYVLELENNNENEKQKVKTR